MRWWGSAAGWCRAVYVAGFAEGTAAHVVDLVRGGLDAYESFPYAPVRALFLALVVLDPLVVLLLLRAPVAGVAAGVLVMTLDLAANLTANAADIAATPARTLPGMTPLLLFGAFVLATARPLTRSLRGRTPARALPEAKPTP
ncbi:MULTISPECIES: hypothetical protein [unclassified Streptomyces]|uniref:hypothetical protein n=1 Tax=unclassified Streptomyces TaxID=2593676 RepID=UPI00081F5DD5|nr:MULTISPECIES: hypothetical protein [unclassified Streptomyces]SCF43523.1 hypothetical protein GA0115257_116598 [Streptomyces sp. LcepLS]